MRAPFFIICTVGAYSVSNSYLDVVMMMGSLHHSLSSNSPSATSRHVATAPANVWKSDGPNLKKAMH
jgi:hypothetical protein